MRTTGAMTERQRRFAAKNHNLIYRYLHEKGWEVSEYYDIAAFGYLRAVRRYLTEPGLSIYAFSSIAWQANPEHRILPPCRSAEEGRGAAVHR